jgi:hypothetical protein
MPYLLVLNITLGGCFNIHVDLPLDYFYVRTVRMQLRLRSHVTRFQKIFTCIYLHLSVFICIYLYLSAFICVHLRLLFLSQQFALKNVETEHITSLHPSKLQIIDYNFVPHSGQKLLVVKFFAPQLLQKTG